MLSGLRVEVPPREDTGLVTLADDNSLHPKRLIATEIAENSLLIASTALHEGVLAFYRN